MIEENINFDFDYDFKHSNTELVNLKNPINDTEDETIELKDLQIDDAEVSEEQASVTNTIQKFVVEINGVRCTILYPGETLSSIAMKYDIPKSKLLEYNETTSEEDITEGDIVFLDKKKNNFSALNLFTILKEGEKLRLK